MAIEIKVPSVGESVSEGSIARWLKKDGAVVRTDEPLFELETEKASQEVPSPATGTLHIEVPEGGKVRIGAVVGRIEAGAVPEGKETAEPSSGNRSPSTSGKEVDRKEPVRPQSDGIPVAASPSARRLATENSIDMTQIAGSGKGGAILEEDVRRVIDRPAMTSPPAETSPENKPSSGTALPAVAPSRPGERETRQRMSAIRARIADRLLMSQRTTASLTTFNEADLTAILDLRARYKESFQKKHGVSLGFMSFFVKACVEALQAYPLVNARIDGDDIVLQHTCNIGVAVSTEKGLMVPVLREAENQSFADIEKNLADLAKKAREGKIAVTDLQGGTFTITNGGVFGSMLSTPILNPPQSAILGMHSIQKRPVVRDDQIVIRSMMYLALTYDHRLIDGREAVLFLVRVKECLENPERMLLSI